MDSMYREKAFAPVDGDLHLERIAGGNETEVYRTDDQRFVVKLKTYEQNGTAHHVLAETKILRDAAERFSTAVGLEHSIPNYFVITQNNEGQAQLLVLQPYLSQAQPLFNVDYTSLSKAERKKIAEQLRRIIRRSLKYYPIIHSLPDLYGRSSRNKAERKRLNAHHMLPWRLWSFLAKRNILRSHNLMLTNESDPRIILVDYDPVQRSKLYRFVYYTVRRLLFYLRDYMLIWVMQMTGFVPKA